MPYIGRGPELGVRSRFIYTATANQTSFSGNDDAGITLAYTDTLYMDVYQNGVLLVPATDYAATTGTSVVLVQGASADDTVELLVFDIFSVADSVSAANGGSFSGNVGMGGTLAVTGTSTLTGNTTVGGTLGVTGVLTTTAATVFNGGFASNAVSTITTADNLDTLSLISTDADANAGPNLRLYRNSANPADSDTLGTLNFEGRNDNSQDVTYAEINTIVEDASDGTEDGMLIIKTIVGGTARSRMAMTAAGGTVFNEDSQDLDFRVESNGSANMLLVDGGGDEVLIQRASSGGTAGANSVLIIEDDDNTEVSILGGSSSLLALNFGHSGDVDDGKITYDTSNGSEVMAFNCNAQEVMRITAAKKFAMGTTTILNGGGALASFAFAGAQGVFISTVSQTGGQCMGFVHQMTSVVGSINIDSSSTAYATSSDYRLKENVDYTWEATTRLKQLKPARFSWIVDETNTLVDGFLAHEVSSVVPNAVVGTKDAMKEEVLYVEDDELPDGKNVGDVKEAAGPDYQHMDHSKLVPLLVKTIQELEARITALEAK